MSIKILMYDIETLPIQALVWRCGMNQSIRTNNIIHGAHRNKIACITWAICEIDPNKEKVKPVLNKIRLGEKISHSTVIRLTKNIKSGVIKFDYKTHNESDMINKFLDIIESEEPHTIVGKNNKRFDDGFINLASLLQGRNFNFSTRSVNTYDIEQQTRKHFKKSIPSHSLEYLTEYLFGFKKPKIHTTFEMWKEITLNQHINRFDITTGGVIDNNKLEKLLKIKDKKAKKAFDYLCVYGKRDAEVQLMCMVLLMFAIDPLYPKKPSNETPHVCPHCGSSNLKKNGTFYTHSQYKQRWHCNGCNSYAGQSVISKTGKVGKVR